MNFNLHLFIKEIVNMPVDKLEGNSSYIVQIEWRGSRRTGRLLKGFRRDCTEKRQTQRSGSLSWNEGFDHPCKLKKIDSDMYRSWIINLKIQEIKQNSRGKKATLGKASVNIAEFVVMLENERNIGVPMKCNFKGHPAEAELRINLRFVATQTSNKTAFTLPRAFSCAGAPQIYSNRLQYLKQDHANNDINHSSSESVPDFTYSELKIANILLGAQFPNKLDHNHHLKQTDPENSATQEQQRKPSLLRLLSRNISNQFVVGNWEKKKIVSRDEVLELTANIFFASIDQRSEKASGGGACTVLATVIAHWLHENPKRLPLRSQLDELVHQGSSEWRKLCNNDILKEKFSDQHFDLETVLESRVRPLEVVTDKSYVGLFSLDNAAKSSMSFDSIWTEIVGLDKTEERVYVVSWNDHFFVVKVEKEVVYLIDTLGERLFEGCNQAYMVRFDKKSLICRRTSNLHERRRDVLCRGIDCCKGYIEGFLAEIPLRELRHDIEKGLVENGCLHGRLQIEFHYTTPCRR